MGKGAAQQLWEKFPLKYGDESPRLHSTLHWIPNPDAVDTYALSDADIATLRRVCPDHSPSRPNWLWIKSQLIFRGGQSPESVKQLSAEMVLEFLKTLPATEPTRRESQRFLVIPRPFAEKTDSLELVFLAARRLVFALDNYQRTVRHNWFPKNIGIHFWQFAMEVARLGWMSSVKERHRLLSPIYEANDPAEFDGRSWQSYHDAALGIGEKFLSETHDAGQLGNGPEWQDSLTDEKFYQQGKTVTGNVAKIQANWRLPNVDFVSLAALLDREYVKATSVRSLPSPAVQRALVELDPPCIRLDGKSLPVPLAPDAAVWLKWLIECDDRVSDPAFRKAHPETYPNARPERWRKKLPKVVLNHIDTNHSGSRWLQEGKACMA